MKHHKGNLRKMHNAAAPKPVRIITESPRVIVPAEPAKEVSPRETTRMGIKIDWEMAIVVGFTVVLGGLEILLAGRIGGAW